MTKKPRKAMELSWMKDRAQQKPGHMPPQPTNKQESDDAMQPTREKSGF
jgi:hypothetical protein